MKYYVDIIKKAQISSAEKILSNAELEIYNNFRFDKKKHNFLLGRYSAKKFFSQKYGVALQEVKIAKEKSGKPYLLINNNHKDEIFSLSHTDDLCIFVSALGKDSKIQAIGVDIEKIEIRSDAWAKQSFTQKELSAKNPSECLNEYLTKLWTQKESILKLFGIGMSADLWDIEVIRGEVFLKGKMEKLYAHFNDRKITLISKNIGNYIFTVAYV